MKRVSIKQIFTVYTRKYQGLAIALAILLYFLPIVIHILTSYGTFAQKMAQPAIAVMLLTITVVIVFSIKRLYGLTTADLHSDLEHPLWPTFEKIVVFLVVSVIIQLYLTVFTADKNLFWPLYFTLGALFPIISG